MIDIDLKEKCCGCGVCAVVYSVLVITIKLDKEGFVFVYK